MDATSVTLDEVIAAARVRAASLVPETSGYLALAIADASARLPFRLEDRLVSLSTEGTVAVKRGTEVVEPEESAVVLRDTLGRLIALSIGSAPGLAAASRVRARGDQVESFIHELETALVPVNRAAARRALARLARETVRARDAGKLKRRPASERPRPAPSRPAPARPGVEQARRVLEERRSAGDAVPVGPTAGSVASGRAPTPQVAPALGRPFEETPPPMPVDVEIPVELDPIDATPLELEPPVVLAGDAATALDTELAERILCLEPMQHSELGGASRSDVDELLARFRISEAPTESTKVALATPRAIAKLAGIDLSAVPPPAASADGAGNTSAAPPARRALSSDEVVLVVRRRPPAASADGAGNGRGRRDELPRSAAPPVADGVADTSAAQPTSAQAADELGVPIDEVAAAEAADAELAALRSMASIPGRPRWPLAFVAALGLAIVAGLGHFTKVLW
jgi:hypothetical protein